jgi:sugar transferase (PEP-CTERM/EpsH1 system associated)
MERPIVVVHVSFGLDLGGQEKLLVELARHADRRRVVPVFACLGHRGVLADEIEAYGGEVVVLGEPSGLKLGMASRLARLFRRLRPYVVHTHDNRSLVHAVPAARMARVPRVVHTRHGRNAGTTPRQLWLIRHLVRWVDDYVCVSGDAAALSVSEGIPATKLRTILNGIDMDRFSYSGPCPGGPIVSVSRLNPEKDVASLVHAAAIAARHDPALRVEVAGDGPCRADVQRTIDELGLGRIVTLLGAIREVPELLSRASLFVLPSRTEGISLTLLEAMARGLPAVATRVGGSPEVVLEGESGLLVPAQDPQSLAAALLEIRRDPARGEQMGLAGRRHVERTFNIRRMVADYEALYARVTR